MNNFIKKIIGAKEKAAASAETTAQPAQSMASATAEETMRQFGVDSASTSAAPAEAQAPMEEAAPAPEAAAPEAAAEEPPAMAEAAAVEEAPAEAAGPEIYVVQSGDSLSAIAQQLYGDAGQYMRIFEANRDKISDPNLIYPGQELVIPR